MSRKSPQINVIEKAIRKVSRQLLRDFNEVDNLQMSKKGPSDFVTAADLKADKTLRQELSHAWPNYGFRTEEGEDIIGDGQHRWIIDPLDGTTNFVHAIPHFAISVALEKDGELITGVVFDPARDEMFWAEKGLGAWVENTHGQQRRVKVSGRTQLNQSVMGTGIPHYGRGDHPLFLQQLELMMGHVAGVRRMGAAALDLAYVAAGRLDGFWELGLSSWDQAAGILLIREAGGVISDFNGDPIDVESPTIVAGNVATQPALQKLLLQAQSSLDQASSQSA